jgi:hypothetical protein
VIPQNERNRLARSGIENAFPEVLLEGFIKTTTNAKGETISKQFDQSFKREFADFIVRRNDVADFAHFASLVEEIKRIQAL